MNKKIYSAFLRLFVSAFFVFGCFSAISAQATAFTYQGRLTDGSNQTPSGTYQMKFTLHTAVSGANNQVGAEVYNTSVAVANGVFFVQLDFGAEFSGANRWLEVSVKKTSEIDYTTLSPRHAITSVPYSIRTLSAGSADSLSSVCIGCVTDSNITTVSGSKITGTVANADNANTAATATTATTATTALSVSSTTGDSIVAAINNAATTTTVSENRLPFTYFRLKPSSTQSSSSTTLSDAVFDVTNNFNDGNGNLTEKSRFRFNYNGSFYASGEYNSGSTNGVPIEGSGTRMMWYPGKAAFRAGYVNGTQWDDGNTGLYSTAFGENARALGNHGFSVGRDTASSGDYGVSMGWYSTASGTASVALGMGANTNVKHGSFVFADRSYTAICDTTLVAGSFYYPFGCTDSRVLAPYNNSFTVRASGGTRFYTNVTGTTGLYLSSLNNSQTGGGNQYGSFVWTDRSSDTAITPTAQNQTIFRSSGGFIIYSNSGASSGVTLAAGAGAWTSLSDRNMKENFKAVNSREILRGVLVLPISTWNYKTQDSSIRHIGAMAQDFSAIFNVGENDTTISTIDPDGVALAAIQGLNEEIKDRDLKIEAQQRQLKTLAEQVKQQAEQVKQQSERLDQQQGVIDSLRDLVCQNNSAAEVCKGGIK